MNFIQRIFAKRKQMLAQAQEEDRLLNDLEIAKQEWHAARTRLDQVTAEAEIDYAIYAYEAAQKRYELLLRHIRDMKDQSVKENSETSHSSADPIKTKIKMNPIAPVKAQIEKKETTSLAADVNTRPVANTHTKEEEPSIKINEEDETTEHESENDSTSSDEKNQKQSVDQLVNTENLE